MRKSQAERNRSDHSWARIPGVKTMGNLFKHTCHPTEDQRQRSQRRDAKEAAAPASSKLFSVPDASSSSPSPQKQVPSILAGGEGSEKSKRAVAEVSFVPLQDLQA